MSKILDEKISKDISSGLNLNYVTKKPLNTYRLPKFDKNENGEYVFVGNCTISTLKEFRAYLRAYKEIASFLRKNYKPAIASIYKNALNSLVADISKFRIADNDYSLVRKLSEAPFTTTSLNDNSAVTYGNILSYLTKAAFKTKRLKPSAEINNLLKADNKTLESGSEIYVLPLMTDNGVVLSQKKQNKNAMEAQFQTVSYSAAREIENYMVEATRGIDNDSATQIKNQIAKLFKEAHAIGESVKAGINSNLSQRLEKLSSDFIDLIGVDLMNYTKTQRPVVKRSKQIDEAPLEAPQNEVYDTPAQTAVAQGSAAESKGHPYYANEILMNGSYKTSPAIEDGRIVTKLSPEGMRFVVTLKNNKLLVSNEQSDEQGFGQF